MWLFVCSRRDATAERWYLSPFDPRPKRWACSKRSASQRERNSCGQCESCRPGLQSRSLSCVGTLPSKDGTTKHELEPHRRAVVRVKSYLSLSSIVRSASPSGAFRHSCLSRATCPYQKFHRERNLSRS